MLEKSKVFTLKGDNFYDFLFGFPAHKSFLKRGCSVRKGFTPRKSKFFPFIVEFFQKEGKQFLLVPVSSCWFVICFGVCCFLVLGSLFGFRLMFSGSA